MKDWEEFVKENPGFADFDLKEQAVIRKVGSKWCVFSESGRRFGCYSSRKAAEHRLHMIEWFRDHKVGSEEEIARTYCYCLACGHEFASRERCDLSRCPVCGEQDDLIELEGIR